MALPTSGQISINNINTEYGYTSGTEASLGTLSTKYGFTAPNILSGYYGMQNNNFIIEFSNITTVTINPIYEAYRSIIMPAVQPNVANRYRFSINLVINSPTYGKSWAISWSLNSTSVWTNLASGVSAYPSTDFIIPTLGVLDSNDIIRIRVYGQAGGSGPLSGAIELNYGIFSIGSGTISTIVSPLLWNLYF